MKGKLLMVVAGLPFLALLLAACADEVDKQIDQGKALLAEGRFAEAKEVFQAVLAQAPTDCQGRYGLLLAQSGLLTDFVNAVPYRGDVQGLVDQRALLRELADRVDVAARLVEEKKCAFDLERLPFSIGRPEAPYARGEFRGRWRLQEALFLGAWANIWQYFAAAIDNMVVGRKPSTAKLPAELQTMHDRLERAYSLLFSGPPNPQNAVIAWADTDGDGVPSPGDRLLINLFEPESEQRVIDLSEADFFLGEWQPPPPAR